ncbi:hypothetical protein [Paraburkholderia silvatlantica]|uniref:Uncharacterized protein n=1 Tax=Paraburkholderia silvatlantica TaxID=321895 RepID=A0A2V4UA41_9BURK|nr:hypothetical protein [Paraburkholderia silvatlantica]PYE21237.1 hypothetical protein C7410_11580 [Paraburkholderia silvatlantica]TDQ86622.1 hypothetical protein C7412_117117 [Paraburkholderia silvatlantica]
MAVRPEALQLYGLLDSAIGNVKASGDPSSTVGMLNSGQITSFYGMRGSEDLGGDVKAGRPEVPTKCMPLWTVSAVVRRSNALGSSVI